MATTYVSNANVEISRKYQEIIKLLRMMVAVCCAWIYHETWWKHELHRNQLGIHHCLWQSQRIIWEVQCPHTLNIARRTWTSSVGKVWIPVNLCVHPYAVWGSSNQPMLRFVGLTRSRMKTGLGTIGCGSLCNVQLFDCGKVMLLALDQCNDRHLWLLLPKMSYFQWHQFGDVLLKQQLNTQVINISWTIWNPPSSKEKTTWSYNTLGHQGPREFTLPPGCSPQPRCTGGEVAESRAKVPKFTETIP